MGLFRLRCRRAAWQLAAFLARLDPSDKKGVTAWLRGHGLLNGKRPRTSPTHGRGACVAEYVYRDALENLLARKIRFEPGANGRKKDFAWQRLKRDLCGKRFCGDAPFQAEYIAKS